MVEKITRPSFGMFDDYNRDNEKNNSYKKRVSYIVPNKNYIFDKSEINKPANSHFSTIKSNFQGKKNRMNARFNFSEQSMAINNPTIAIPVPVVEPKLIDGARGIATSKRKEKASQKPLNKLIAFASVVLVVLAFFGASFFTTMSTDMSIKKTEITETLDGARQKNQAKELEIEQKKAKLEETAKSYGLTNADKTFTMSLQKKQIYGM